MSNFLSNVASDLGSLFGKFHSIMAELGPLAQVAVVAVQIAAPQVAGAEKFAAATKSVLDAINATTVAEGAFSATKAALASGDSATVTQAIGHNIEIALSLSKTLGLFPKAAVVQSAAPLDTGVRADANAPG